MKIVKFLEDSVLLRCYLNNWKWNEKTNWWISWYFLSLFRYYDIRKYVIKQRCNTCRWWSYLGWRWSHSSWHRNSQRFCARRYKNTGFIMLPYPLNNFEAKRYYQNEWRFNNVYSRNRFPKTKNRTYVINFDEYESIATHWKA